MKEVGLRALMEERRCEVSGQSRIKEVGDRIPSLSLPFPLSPLLSSPFALLSPLEVGHRS